jgi:hypothetical protein
VVWNRVFKEEETALKICSIFFDAMGEYRLGKNAKIFEEFAQEAGALVVRNMHYQKTR